MSASRRRRPLPRTASRSARRHLILGLVVVAVGLQAWKLLAVPPEPGPAPAAVETTTAAPADSPEGGREASPSPAITLTVPPPPGSPTPAHAVLLYEQAETSATPPTRGSSPSPQPAPTLYPPELMRALILLDREGQLSSRQARRLLEAMEGVPGLYDRLRQAQSELDELLTAEQKAYLREQMKDHPPPRSNRPPEQVVGPGAREALEALSSP